MILLKIDKCQNWGLKITKTKKPIIMPPKLVCVLEIC